MEQTEIVVAGAGIGALSAAAVLAAAGRNVTVYEAAAVPGGCASVFSVDGAVFDAGATTLVGFEPGMPLHTLGQLTGITLPKRRLATPMEVHLEGKRIVRFEDRTAWIAEASRCFGNPDAQARFWTRIFALSDLAWDVSARLDGFPPRSVADWIRLAGAARPRDLRALPALYASVAGWARDCGLDQPAFLAFLDGQLMITAQAPAHDTPLLFGAPALAYPNSPNYALDGGIGTLANALVQSIEKNGGRVRFRSRIDAIRTGTGGWALTVKRKTVAAPVLVSGLTIWDLKRLLGAPEAAAIPDRYDALGAFTIYLLAEGRLPEGTALHHQVHTGPIPHGKTPHVFISFPHPEDAGRAPDGLIPVTLSTHTRPDDWFGEKDVMLARRKETAAFMKAAFLKQFPMLRIPDEKTRPASPFTWQRWAFRHKGRAGGIPQSMKRSLFDWPDAAPIPGLFLCGDTVWPGQGIPAAALSGLHAARRVLRFVR